LKTIEFTIENGQVTIETSGFTGAACEAATKAFEEALGGNIGDKTRKREYYAKAAAPRIQTGNSPK